MKPFVIFFFSFTCGYSAQRASQFRTEWLLNQSLHCKWDAFHRAVCCVGESEPLLRGSSCSKNRLKVLSSDLWSERLRALRKRQGGSVCYYLLQNNRERLCVLLSFRPSFSFFMFVPESRMYQIFKFLVIANLFMFQPCREIQRIQCTL